MTTRLTISNTVFSHSEALAQSLDNTRISTTTTSSNMNNTASSSSGNQSNIITTLSIQQLDNIMKQLAWYDSSIHSILQVY
jgi:hypothetical protein